MWSGLVRPRAPSARPTRVITSLVVADSSGSFIAAWISFAVHSANARLSRAVRYAPPSNR